MSSSLPLFDLLHTPVPRQSQQTLLSPLATMAIDHVPCIPPARVRLMESQRLCGHGRLASSCQFSSDWWAQSAYKPAQTSICNQLRTFNWPTVCKYWRSIGELESTSASATCSQKTRYPPVMAPSLAITFGVEFEMVLAFHEKELVRIMRQKKHRGPDQEGIFESRACCPSGDIRQVQESSSQPEKPFPQLGAAYQRRRPSASP